MVPTQHFIPARHVAPGAPRRPRPSPDCARPGVSSCANVTSTMHAKALPLEPVDRFMVLRARNLATARGAGVAQYDGQGASCPPRGSSGHPRPMARQRAGAL